MSELFIPITYSMAYSKDVKKADIIAYYSENGEGLNKIIVAKDAKTSHPYRFSDLDKEIKKIHPDSNFCAQYFSDFRKKYNIETKPEYFYEFHGTKVYSQKLLDFILDKMSKDDKLFRKAKKEDPTAK